MRTPLIFLLLSLVACTPVEEGSVDALFCPEEDCEGTIIRLVEGGGAIRCAFYDLGLDNLTSALVRGGAAVLVYEENSHGLPRAFRAVQSKGLMHDKFCVFNESTVVTGSMNPTHNGAYRNDNNLVVIESRTVARNYLAEWAELQLGTSIKTEETIVRLTGDSNVTVENYFCPEDGCEERIIKILEEAEESIRFMAFTFTSDHIGRVLAAKQSVGVDVRGVMEARQRSAYWEYDKLRAARVDVVLDDNPYTMHHKVFIIDDHTVITGSYNPTRAADERNDENIIVIRDEETAEEFLREYEKQKLI